MEDDLFSVLVENKPEFVELFIERIDMKTFLDDAKLERLYKKVVSSVYNQRTNIKHF